MEAKKCSEFNIGILAKQCSDLSSSLPIDTKKCSFSDNSCKTVDITSCSELTFTRYVTEENCKTATTSSSNLKCIYKDGCKVVNIYENTDSTDENNNTSDNTKNENKSDNKGSENENNGNKGNSSQEKYLNKLLLILLCVLV